MGHTRHKQVLLPTRLPGWEAASRPHQLQFKGVWGVWEQGRRQRGAMVQRRAFS